jgi:hypothetical protein
VLETTPVRRYLEKHDLVDHVGDAMGDVDR